MMFSAWVLVVPFTIISLSSGSSPVIRSMVVSASLVLALVSLLQASGDDDGLTISLACATLSGHTIVFSPACH